MKLRLQKDSGQNTLIVLANLTTLLGVRISKKALQYVKHHPDRLTLQFVTNTLLEWGIEAVPLNLNDKSRIGEIDVPALAHLLDDGGRFIVITEITSISVKFHDPLLGWQIEDRELFNKHWSGVILVIEKLDDEGEVNRNSNVDIESEDKRRQYFLLIATSLLGVASLVNCPSLTIGALDVLYMLGVLVSIIIVTVEFGDSEMLRYCQIGGKLDCSSVLHSQGANMFGLFKASSLGVVWFLGNWLSLNLLVIAAHDKEAILNHLAILGLLSIAYVPFSLIYQGIVLKRWCVLCLAIQLVLVMIFGISMEIAWPFQSFTRDIGIIGLLVLAFTLSLVSWVFSKTLLQSRVQLESLEAQVLQFAGDSSIFQHVLETSEKMSVPDWPTRLKVGRSTSSPNVVMIVKLDCDACAKAVKLFVPFIERHLHSVQFEFVISNQSESPIHAEIASILLSVAEEQRLEAIESWYDRMDHKNFTSHYSLPINANSTAILSEHNEWCRTMNITMTPRIIVDGKLVPTKHTTEQVVSHLISMISLQEHE